MIIKKFTASTEAEAILLAKKELGMDAIVMNIKKNLPRGIYKLFRKPSVEITAAVDENGKQQKAKEEPVKRNPNIIYEDEVPTSLGGGSTAIEQRLDKLQDILENQITIRTNKLESDGGEEKEAVAEEDTDSNLACLQLIYNQMIANEVDETYANKMIVEIEHSLKKNTGMNNILTSMYQKIVLKLGQIHAIEAGKTQPKYIFFIGPTGVGKTTTIAKIASMLKMNKKKKIALMTADTYRIAAVEQLTTYANILDIPLHVVYSPEEVKEAKEKLKDYDIVLVDTAGRSYKNREQRDDLERLLNSVPEKEREVFLVLSATTKYYDLLKITDSYLQIVDYALIFTKLDETNCIGNLLNIRMKTGAPLSYATFGQNVPDDISAIDPQNIAKQLLGGSE